MLHGDGQYAPEVIESIVAPVASGEADMVMGSRMMTRGAALQGGMPLYKFVGNRILTRFQNAVTGAGLSEWHSGYRAYRTDALADIPFEEYSDDYDFDTEIILGMLEAGKTIVEVPIPTYYGDEVCYVNGIRYARDVVADVVRHRARSIGFGQGRPAPTQAAYELKPSPHSSHGRLLSWLAGYPAGKVLDVGCSDGRFGELVRGQGHVVTGLDLVKHEGVGGRLDEFVEADLNHGIPEAVGRDFDVIVAGDIIEHTVDPAKLVREMAGRLAPGGSILVSIPNFGHWYPRTRVALGRFDYDSRGPLDEGHVRFFTRRSFERLVADCGLTIVARDTVGSPLDVLERGGSARVGSLARGVGSVDRSATRVWPTLFGYQFLYKLARA
jgi:2-polyprenyl-3-methyl-5-hydroxy-6-metoxy-1,4-benzoquinol methylase